MIQLRMNEWEHSLDFVIGDYLPFLEKSPNRQGDKKYKFVCPNCGDDELSISADGLKYDCYGCHDKSEIASILRKKANELKKKESPKLSSSVKIQTREWIYLDKEENELIKVKRIDKGGEKSIYQYSKDENGNWVKGLKGISQKDATLLYVAEVRQAVKDNKPVFIVEGEPCADSLRNIGVGTTTNLGGSGKNYHAYETLKNYANIIICPDRDVPGIKHCEKIAEILPQAKFLYSKPDSKLWQLNLAKDGDGFDIADWIERLKIEGLNKEEIREKIMEGIEDQPRELNIEDRKATTHKIKQFPKVDPKQAFLAIDNCISQGYVGTALKQQLVSISKEFGISVYDLENLYQSKLDQLEDEETLNDRSDQLDNLIAIENSKLNLTQILPVGLGATITELAKKICTTPEHILTSLLPAIANGIGTKSKIIINASMGYTQPAILRTMLVANSGDRKSPTLSVATSFLEELEIEARENYKKAVIEYEEEMTEWENMGEEERKGLEPPEEPQPTRYIVKDSNHDGKIKIHEKNPVGLLEINDELVGGFNRMNRTGRGDDEQQDLELFNGKSVSKDRQGEEFCRFIPKTAISMVGTIQWGILKKLIRCKGDDDPAGVLSRWLMCGQPLPEAKLDILSDDDGLFEYFKKSMKEIFLRLRSLPETDYILSYEAKVVWQKFQHELEDMRQTEVIEALKTFYPKLESYMSRLALVLHCLEAVEREETPESTVSVETMKRAIKLSKYYLGQTKLILAKASPAQEMTGDLLKIRDYLIKKGSLTASTVKNRLKHLGGKKGQQAVKIHFETLVTTGIAEWVVGRGLKIKLRQIPNQVTTKLRHSEDTPNPIYNNSLTEEKNTKLRQVPTKLRQSKPNDSKSLDTKLRQKDNFNFSFEVTGEDINTSPSVSKDMEKDKPSREKSRNLDLKPSQGEGWDCRNLSRNKSEHDTSNPNNDSSLDSLNLSRNLNSKSRNLNSEPESDPDPWLEEVDRNDNDSLIQSELFKSDRMDIHVKLGNEFSKHKIINGDDRIKFVEGVLGLKVVKLSTLTVDQCEIVIRELGGAEYE